MGFWDKIYCPTWPQTCDPPASTTWVLGLWAVLLGSIYLLIFFIWFLKWVHTTLFRMAPCSWFLSNPLALIQWTHTGRKAFRGRARGRLVGSGLFLLSQCLALWAGLCRFWKDHSYCQVTLHRDRQDFLGSILLFVATLKISHPSLCPLEPSGLQEAFIQQASLPIVCSLPGPGWCA